MSTPNPDRPRSREDRFPLWDWPGIHRAEAAAKAKADRLPKCRLCGQPMWLGQVDVHIACGRTHGDTDTDPASPVHPRPGERAS